MASINPSVSTVRRSAIEKLHGQFAQEISKTLRGECEIQPVPDARARWHRREVNENVEFFLWPKNSLVQWGLRTGGRVHCPLVAAKQTGISWQADQLAWVAWREAWTRQKVDTFSLREAALTFFWGREGIQPIEHQLFRAEWPQGTAASDMSAQPHWQVDWPLASLDDYISSVHFGMAGWECAEHASTEVHLSKHWRRKFSGTPDELLTWAVRTLEYSVDQIAQYYAPHLIS